MGYIHFLLIDVYFKRYKFDVSLKKIFFSLTSYLKPTFDKVDNRAYNPHCIETSESPPIALDHLTNMILKNRLPSSPEKDLTELLGLMTSDQKSSVRELGTKINLALKEVSFFYKKIPSFTPHIYKVIIYVG